MSRHNSGTSALTTPEVASPIEPNHCSESSGAPARQSGPSETDKRPPVRNRSRSSGLGCVLSLFGQTFDEPVADRHKKDQDHEHNHPPGACVPKRVSVPCLLVDIRG